MLEGRLECLYILGTMREEGRRGTEMVRGMMAVGRCGRLGADGGMLHRLSSKGSLYVASNCVTHAVKHHGT